MAGLFTPGTIGPMAVRNRIVRSATHEGMTDGTGQLGPGYASFLAALAEGEVGLIVTGHLYVREDGRGNRNQAGIDHDRFVPRLREAREALHRHGARLVAQLSHAGANADARAAAAVGPSAVADPGYRHLPVA